MRMLSKNKVPYWYALYLETVKVLDDDGRYTGTQEIKYSEPIKAYGNISASKGDAYVAQFGTAIDYDAVLCVDDTEIDENSILWVGTNPTETYNYRVKRVSRSLNGTAIAIKKIDIG